MNNTLSLSVLIGLAAGIADVIPMIIRNVPVRFIVSALLRYLFVSVIVLHLEIPGLTWWLAGPLVSLMVAVPITVITSGTDWKNTPAILIDATVFGALIGIAGHFLK